MAAVCPGAPRKRPQLRIRIPIYVEIPACGKRRFRNEDPIRYGPELPTTPTNQPLRVDKEALLRAPERPGKRRYVVSWKGRKLMFWT